MSDLNRSVHDENDRLLNGIRAGDEAALDELARLFYPRLTDYAATITGDSAAALDVVQDVLLGLWQNRGTLAPTTTLRAYLFRAVRNRAINDRRNTLRRPGSDTGTPSTDTRAEFLPGDSPAPDSHLQYRALIADYHKAIRALPERRQAVYRLVRLYGMSYSETASILSVSENTVRTQMSDALREIRSALADHLD